jgi:hypothetical protein
MAISAKEKKDGSRQKKGISELLDSCAIHYLAEVLMLEAVRSSETSTTRVQNTTQH